MTMALIIFIPAVVVLVKVMVGHHFRYIRQQLILIICFSGSLIAYSLCLIIGFNNDLTQLYMSNVIFSVANVTLDWILWRLSFKYWETSRQVLSMIENANIDCNQSFFERMSVKKAKYQRQDKYGLIFMFVVVVLLYFFQTMFYYYPNENVYIDIAVAFGFVIFFQQVFCCLLLFCALLTINKAALIQRDAPDRTQLFILFTVNVCYMITVFITNIV